MIPGAKPSFSREKADTYLHFGLRGVAGIAGSVVTLLGVRGYYLDSMGAAGANDRGIYDDAMAVVSPAGIMTFNANTDPTVCRKGIAVLKAGVWLYKPGTHGLSRPKAQQYPAFVQAGEVTVIRDEKGPDTGWFGINIHRGGHTTTSSLGCQTIPPEQWEGFHALLRGELKRAGQVVFRYVLVEEREFRQRGH